MVTSPRIRNALSAALFGSALAGPALQAQATCESPAAREFDFWLGDWEIVQELLLSDGSWRVLPARSSVRREVGGCAVIERWEGSVQFSWEGMDAPEPMVGLSVRAWDPEQNVWRIWWMDSRRPGFGEPFVGGFDGDVGTFQRQSASAAGARTTRIRFYRITDHGVCWDLGVSRGPETSWTTLWRMRFSRAGPSQPAVEPACDVGPPTRR